MLQFEGVHATCQGAAKSITNLQRFDFGSGHAGMGVYFWKKDPFGMELARGYYVEGTEGHKRRFPDDWGFSAFESKLECEEDSFLNLDLDVLIDGLEILYLSKKHLFKYGEIGLPNVTALLDEFIEAYEEENEVQVWIVQKRVPAPRSFGAYPRDVFHHPRCYVVRVGNAIEEFRKVV